MTPNPKNILMILSGALVGLGMLLVAIYQAIWLVVHDKDPVLLCMPLLLWICGAVFGSLLIQEGME